MRVGQERKRVVRWATLFTIRDTHFPRFTSFRSVHYPFHSFIHSLALARSFIQSFHYISYLSFLSILFSIATFTLRSLSIVSFNPLLFATGLSLHLWEAPKLFFFREQKKGTQLRSLLFIDPIHHVILVLIMALISCNVSDCSVF